MNKPTCLILVLAMLAATPAWAQDMPMTWCAATVSGIPGPQKTYYSPLFPTPDDSTQLDGEFKTFITAKYAGSPKAIVDAQCPGQAAARDAAAMRKANEASDGRLSTVVEVGWRP